MPAIIKGRSNEIYFRESIVKIPEIIYDAVRIVLKMSHTAARVLLKTAFGRFNLLRA
jgi:hypothetical protein